MKIKQVCAQTGLTARAVRFYCERGLIHPAVYEQNERNYYEYSQEDVLVLRRVSTLRQAEFSLEEISRMMMDETEMRAVARKHMKKLAERETRVVQLLNKMSELCDRDELTFASFADALEENA